MRRPQIRVVGEEELCRGKRFSFVSVDIEVDGRRFRRDLLKHPGAVVITPILGDGLEAKLIMVRQWRVGCNCWLLELPAGTLEEGEKPEETARRELVEETGYRPGKLVYLGVFYSSPGTSTEVMHFFLALDLEHIGAQPEEDEVLEVTYVSFTEAVRRALRGEYRDAKTTLGILLAAHRLGVLARLTG